MIQSLCLGLYSGLTSPKLPLPVPFLSWDSHLFTLLTWSISCPNTAATCYTNRRVIFAIVPANYLAWSSWPVINFTREQVQSKTATAQFITDLRVSHLWEAFSQHSTTQDCSSNTAFCSSLISGCVQQRTFIHLSYYLCPLPQMLGSDRPDVSSTYYL